MSMPETWEVLAWEGLDALTRRPTPPPRQGLFHRSLGIGFGDFIRDGLVDLSYLFRPRASAPEPDPPPPFLSSPSLLSSPLRSSPTAAAMPAELLELHRKSSPRPAIWDDVIGNATAVEILKEQLTAARHDHKPVPHTLLYGPPGTGKSTLAKILAASSGGGFIETTASTFETMSDLLRLIWQVNELRETSGVAPTVFVDEVHMLGSAKGRQSVDQESIFTLLEDWTLHHNLAGKKAFTLPDGQEVVPATGTWKVWPFTVVGATTEPGMLSEALRRRFLVHVELDPYTEAEIAEIITRAGPRMGWTIEPEAAQYLAQYARRNPGRSYQLLTQARNRAVATNQDTITMQVTQDVIARLKLYPLGLTATDVRILQILADHQPRGCGQAELCRAAAISGSQFMGLIEPYLRFLGFIEVASRRIITAKGLEYLASLGGSKA